MRIGIVGTGSMGRNHLRVVNSIKQFELICAADINSQNLDLACQQYNIKTFSDYRQISEMVDGVMISAPTTTHYKIAEYFLKKQKHVLIEKPISVTPGQAARLARFAQNNGLVIGVGHLERFNPAVEYLNGIVNQPRFIEIQRLGSFSPRSLDIDVIMDLMIHDLDIILQWDQSGIKKINASGIPIISKQIDIANARLQFRSGMVVNITASRVSQKKTRKLRVFQKNQYVSVDYSKQRVKSFKLLKGTIVEEIPQIPQVEPLHNLWMNFYKSVTSGKNFNVTAGQAKAALELAIKISNRIKKNLEN